jgi:hypothetical protein
VAAHGRPRADAMAAVATEEGIIKGFAFALASLDIEVGTTVPARGMDAVPGG